MTSKLKSTAATLATGVVLAMTPVGSAIAVWCQADAPQVYANMVSSFMPFVTGLINKTGLSTEGAIVDAGAAVRAEVAKSTIANKTVAEGLEAYRTEQVMREQAMDLEDAAKQSPTTCQAMATSEALTKAQQDSQAAAMRSQSKVLRQVTGNTNTVAEIDAAHKLTNQRYCSAEEAALGVCAGGSGALGGADQDALFLFQGKSGSVSYDSASGQAEAADSYVKRIVGGLPPEHLRERSKAYYDKNPQARAYVELMRRYNAMVSMGSYSLTQIEESRKPIAGLGAATMMANAPGFAANKNDMSMEEAVERFVATKFSPENVQGLMTARQPHLVLRDLSQMQSFQLWMSYQAMLQSSRTEGLLAHQLSLVAEQTLKPQLDAQRQAAMRAKQ